MTAYELRELEALEGRRIRLVRMGSDDPDPMEPGATGTVDFVVLMGTRAHLNMTWDSWVTRSLNLELPADKIEVIE